METLDDILSGRAEFLLDSISDLVFISDTQGNILYANRALRETVGLSMEEIQKKNTEDFFAEEDQLKIIKARRNLKKGEEIRNLEIKAKIGKEKYGYYEINSVTLKEKGNITAFLSVARDISDRKKINSSLRKFKSLFFKSPIGIELFDSNGKNLIANEACIEMFGVEDLSTIKNLELFSSPFIPSDVREKIKGGETARLEIPYNFKRVKNSHRYNTVKEKEDISYLDVLIAPITSRKNKEIINYLIYIQDITKRKIMQQKLKNSLNRSEFYKDLLAHDICNILNNIKSATQLMELWRDNPLKSEDMKEMISLITQQVDRGSSLIKNVRRISEIENKIQTQKSIDLKKMLKEAIYLARSHCQENQLEIYTDFPEETIKINAGEFLLDAFENILLNGCMHNESEIIRLWVSLSPIQKGGKNYIKIEFKDNGVGISNERKKVIFERNKKRNKKSGGMGVGLSLVEKIITLYNGQIWVENRIDEYPSKGSNFVILLEKTTS
jgi:PAS domain S-box-containing protein